MPIAVSQNLVLVVIKNWLNKVNSNEFNDERNDDCTKTDNIIQEVKYNYKRQSSSNK